MKHLVPTVFLVILLAGVSCASDPRTRVNLENRTSQGPVSGLAGDAVRSENATLRIGIAGVISPRLTLESYHELLQYLAAKLGRPVELVQRPTYQEMNELIRDRQVDVGFVCSLAYVDGKSNFNMRLLVAPQVRGATSYYSYLIVPEGSTATGIQDLRGKLFAFSDPLSNTGRLAPTYQLALLGEKPETFFKNSIFTYNHDYSIQAVADGLVDAAAVDSLIYDYFRAIDSPLVRKTRIISTWGPYGMPPVVAHPDIDPILEQRIKSLFLNIHLDPEGKRILDSLVIEQFVEVDDGIYDSLRRMKTKIAGAK